MTRSTATVFKRQPIDADDVEVLLQKLEEEYRLHSWLAVAGGAVAALFGTLVVTLFFYIIAGGLISSVGFIGGYLIISLFTLPIAFYIAWKLKGSVLESTVGGSDWLDNPFMMRRVGSILVVAEIANIGPRLVLWGVGRLQSRGAFGNVDPHRLAEAVVTLALSDIALAPVKLLKDGETADALEPLLGVLMYYELADLSKNADRVWITTQAKKRLGL